MFYRDERLALLIDGHNIHATFKALGFDVDWALLQREFAERGRLMRLVYYTTVIEDEEERAAVRPLLDWMEFNGFNVVSKTTRRFREADGRDKIRRSMNVEIAVDAMKIAPTVDHIVIFSGDGDLTYLVAALNDMGVRVTVASSLKTNPPAVSDALRRIASAFIDVKALENMIGRGRGRQEPKEAGKRT